MSIEIFKSLKFFLTFMEIHDLIKDKKGGAAYEPNERTDFTVH